MDFPIHIDTISMDLSILYCKGSQVKNNGPRSTFGKVSGYRCVSDCMLRGREFDPGQVENDHEIISTVILLPSTESFKKGCCQLHAKVCVPSTGKPLV